MKYDKEDSRLIRTRYRPMKVLKDNLAGVEDEDPTFVDDSHMYYKGKKVQVYLALWVGEFCCRYLIFQMRIMSDSRSSLRSFWSSIK